MSADSTGAIIVLVTCPDEASARDIATRVVEEHLAACVNVVPGVHSVFWWEDRVQQADEVLCVMKSTAQHWDALCEQVVALHPYDTPEVIALNVDHGLQAYLSWIRSSTMSIRFDGE